MMDITLLHWGKPSNRRGRLALSFYISSTVITPDLAILKTSCHFRDAIKKAKFTLSHHNLFQTESKGLAFFSGKTPEHTWRKDLSARFQTYMDDNLLNDGAVLNIFGDEAQIPRQIPFYLKALTVKSANHNASAIAIYVGKSHHGIMSTLISKAPFEDLELVPLATKRQDKDIFDQRVQLHTFLCQDSGAIKLRRTSPEFRDHIKLELRKDNDIKNFIIDIAEAASTATEGTLYIQCLVQNRDAVIKRVEEHIAHYISAYPTDENPEILTRRTKATDSTPSDSPTINTWTTRYQTYLTDKRAHQADSKKPPQSNIPGAISYSDMAAGAYNNSEQHQPQTSSAFSSPTNSRMTAPSLQEQQLEDQIRSLEARLQHQNDTNSASRAASPTSSVALTQTLKKSEFETIMAQQLQMITSLAVSNQAANERMEKQMTLITNLQQTVADLVIRVNDRDSDASTITSNEQRKRRIPHHTSKSAMRRLHPSDAGTVGPTNAPPDPGK